MQYYVTIAGREIPVEVDGDRLVVEGREYRAHLTVVPGTPIRHLMLGAESLALQVARGERGEWILGVAGTSYLAEVIDERTRHIRSLTAGTGKAAGATHLRAPMPGLVVRVMTEAGRTVQAGEGLIVLEAMKMENELRASAAAQVRSILVAPGQAVDKGQVLIEFG